MPKYLIQRHILKILFVFSIIIPGKNLNIYAEKADTNPSTINSDSSSTVKISKDAIKSNVKYSAKDSIVFYAGGEAYLYGDAKVEYEKLELTSNHIVLNPDSSLVHARAGKDSSGTDIGYPVFKDGNESYESKSIDFNFKTKKGLIHNVITQQGEGYVTGERAKKMEDNVFLMENGKYTTCDNHEHPHFYLNLTKAKVKPKEYIVAGPAYLVIEDVPLPLAIPFGFFPFTEKYSSGLLMPTYGEESTRGFYLRNGGYYFALSDFFDLAIRADIYTKGSWGINATSRYKKRYKFNGNFFASYESTVTGDKTLPDYKDVSDVKITWTHTQDAKANPFSTFSASVNFTSTSYNKNNISSYYNPSVYGENNKSSSINYTYNFPESPFSLTTNATVNQRQSDSTISLTLPTIYLNMSRVYPFKREVRKGKEKWFEKIYLNYNFNFGNYISTKQNKLMGSNLLNDWSNGIKNQLGVGASYTLFKYLIISPSLSYNEKWYFKKTYQYWDSQESAVNDSITNGFYRLNNASASLDFSTQLYGFFQPIFGKKIKMIRHVFQPTIGFSFTPDMTKSFPSFGSGSDYYGTYQQKLSDGSYKTVEYGYFSNGYFGGSTSNGSGLINLSVSNNLEMKVASDKDSTGYKKISLIDNLTLGTNYNMFAKSDEAKWADISANLRLKLTTQINLNITASFSPYTYQLDENGTPYKSNVSEMAKNGRLARLNSARTSFSYSFNNQTFKKKKKEGMKDDNNGINPNAETLDEMKEQGEIENAEEESKKETEYDSEGYLKFEMPWNLNFSYSVAYGNYQFNKETLEYDQKLTQTLNFSGSISFSKNWGFNISSGYDFINHEMSYTSCGITRKLHCWTASLSLIPFGTNQSFNFHIGVNSSLLQDLKYEKRTNPNDYPVWY